MIVSIDHRAYRVVFSGGGKLPYQIMLIPCTGRCECAFFSQTHLLDIPSFYTLLPFHLAGNQHNLIQELFHGLEPFYVELGKTAIALR